jgi:hypothetical protein
MKLRERAQLGVALLVLVIATVLPMHHVNAEPVALQNGGFQYSNWVFPATTNGYNSIEINMTPSSDGSPDGYYFAHQFGFKNYSEGGYLGLQTQGSVPTGKIAIISIWHATNATSPQYAGTFGGEGEGWTARISYNWQVGKSYRLKVAKTSGENGDWWGGWVRDNATGAETYIGKIQIPYGRGNLNEQTVHFHERYGGAINSCSDLKPSVITFGRPTANGTIYPSYQIDSEVDIPACKHVYGYQKLADGSIKSVIGQSVYSSVLSSASSSHGLQNLRPGQTVKMTYRLKNTGLRPWTNSGTSTMRLGTSLPYDHNSIFAHSSWLSPTRPSVLKEAEILPGQIGTFESTLLIPTISGSYSDQFMPLISGLTWLTATPLNIYVKALPKDYLWTKVSQTPTSITLSPGQTFTYTLKAKNTGIKPWYKSGSYRITLRKFTTPGQASKFYYSTWVSNQEVGSFTEGSVAVSATGTFTGTFKAPTTPGTYKERFILSVNGVPINDEVADLIVIVR